MHLPLNTPSDEPGIGLPPSQLNRAFPFHLAIGKDFTLVQAGPSLLRVCPDLELGVDIRERFSLVSPEINMDFAALSAQTDHVTLWEHNQSKLRFRGQLLSIDAVSAIVCLWSPWLEDCADMGKHGLLPEDFAIHDPSISLLRTIQSQTIALQDECELTEKLSEQRTGLLDANAELSRQFGLLWDEFVNLQQQEDEVFKIALFANNTDNAVVMTDAQGRVEWVNEAFTQITGYALEEMLGKTPGSILQGEKSDPEVVDYIHRQFRKGVGFGADMINYAKSGREYWVQFEVQPIRDEDDKITNWMAIERDITEQKKYELALIEAKKAAEAANQAKSAFLATMSHEIRTPMNAVLGTLSLLQDSPLNGEQAVWVKSAYTAAHTLLNLIDDILDFSKIEADKLTLQHENFSLKALLDELIQLFQIRTAAKGLSLSLDIDPLVPLALRGDPFRLRQILVNLVGNAIKFTGQGGVSISVFQQEQTGARCLLRFHVKDSGIGIPDNALDTLFNQFVQLDTGPSRRYGGTGLGLAISKRLAVLMGGDIGFSSQTGKGSDFWFTVQLEIAADAPANPNASPTAELDAFPLRQGEPSGKPAPNQDRRKKVAKILVVEDGEINRLVVTAMLGKAGYHVDIAQDGVKGLEAARSGDYDLILMDVHMPEMDGYEATAAIRNLPDHPSRVPILALTANAMQEDRNACFAVGMNDFISKPVKKGHLLAKVANWLRKTDEDAPALALTPASESASAIAVLDEKAWQSLSSHTDAQIMQDIVAIFLDDTESQIQRIVQAASVEDYQTIGFEAHSIKSAAMILGALRLATACRNIENACNNGNLTVALHFSQGLQQVFEETRLALIKQGSGIA
jgi:PAS domain S-box-containing protein